MTITATRLQALAQQLNIHAQILAATTMQQAILNHHRALTPGIKAARTDSDGGRSADTISQPEAAAMTKPDPGAQAAHRIANLITQAERIVDELAWLETQAARKPEPMPTQCPSCTAGVIPVGHDRCNNVEHCNSHRDTWPKCTTCNQSLITGTIGKTKPCKLPDGTPVCDTCRVKARRKGWYTIDDYRLGANVIETEGVA